MARGRGGRSGGRARGSVRAKSMRGNRNGVASPSFGTPSMGKGGRQNGAPSQRGSILGGAPKASGFGRSQGSVSMGTQGVSSITVSY